MFNARSWVLCISHDHAKLFNFDSDFVNLILANVVQPDGNNFTEILAREIEFACGYGGNENIVLCGEFHLISQVCQKVDPEIREKIAGIVPKDITDAAPDVIRNMAVTVFRRSEKRFSRCA
jgi:hypothetical protein